MPKNSHRRGRASPSPAAANHDPFVQEAQKSFTEANGLPSSDVGAISFYLDGAPDAATASGLAQFVGASGGRLRSMPDCGQ